MLGVKLFGFNDIGPKLIQAILQAVALVLMFITMRKLFGTLPAAVGVIIASIYLSAPLMAKYGNVKEQHMIAFMIMGVSCFILYQLADRLWLAILAGAFLSCAPLFKETGISAISAVALFVIAQPLLKHRSWKKTGADILLLSAGAVVVISPICLWLSTHKAPLNYFPYYSFVGRPLAKLIQSPQDQIQPKTTEPNTPETTVQSDPVKQGLFMKFMPAYVRDSWKILKPEQLKQAKLRVFRWYGVLILPIVLALGSIIIRFATSITSRWRIEKLATKRILNSRQKHKAAFIVSLIFGLIFLCIYNILRLLSVPLGTLGAKDAGLLGILCYIIVYALMPLFLKFFSFHLVSSIKHRASRNYDRFVLLFAVWWLLDMVFVWISPRSYEQYYLPLNASGAMLGGYLIAVYHNKLKSTSYKPAWVITGFVGFILMIIASQHIFFGITKSAHSGMAYSNPKKQRGYTQKLNEISRNPQYPWIMVGQYIKNNSTENDKIYVWGWVPGIYIVAQRLSPTPKAFEGTMHTLTPQVLSERVTEILDAFKKEPPKFIVDTRKRHFPWDRPPLELWPQTQKGFLPSVPQIVTQYDQMYAKMLREQIEPAEALRYEAMKPFREYVMQNYKIVQPFGVNILFQRK